MRGSPRLPGELLDTTSLWRCGQVAWRWRRRAGTGVCRIDHGADDRGRAYEVMRPILTISRRLGATVSVVLSGLLVVSGCSVATDPKQVTPEVFVEPANVTSSARAKD